MNKANVKYWVRTSPKLTRGRPPADSYVLKTIGRGSTIEDGDDVRELVLEWDPAKLSPVDNKRLFAYWAGIYGLKEGRRLWSDTDNQGKPLWSVEFTKSGTFVYRMLKQKIRNSELESKVIEKWNSKQAVAVGNYLEFHLKETLNTLNLSRTLSFNQDNDSKVKMRQLLMFVSEEDLLELLYTGGKFRHMKKLLARLGRFSKLPFSVLTSNVKCKFLK